MAKDPQSGLTPLARRPTAEREQLELFQALPGDLVRVPAGSIGRYWAPRHARMLGIYGPNPDAEPSRRLGFRKLGAGDASRGGGG